MKEIHVVSEVPEASVVYGAMPARIRKRLKFNRFAVVAGAVVIVLGFLLLATIVVMSSSTVNSSILSPIYVGFSIAMFVWMAFDLWKTLKRHFPQFVIEDEAGIIKAWVIPDASTIKKARIAITAVQGHWEFMEQNEALHKYGCLVAMERGNGPCMQREFNLFLKDEGYLTANPWSNFVVLSVVVYVIVRLQLLLVPIPMIILFALAVWFVAMLIMDAAKKFFRRRVAVKLYGSIDAYRNKRMEAFTERLDGLAPDQPIISADDSRILADMKYAISIMEKDAEKYLLRELAIEKCTRNIERDVGWWQMLPFTPIDAWLFSK